MLHHLNVNLRVATAMSQFYSLLRKLKPLRGFDLNSFAPDENYPSQSSAIYVVTDCENLPSPWDLGYSWSTQDVNTSHVLERLNSIQDDDRYIPITPFFFAASIYVRWIYLPINEFTVLLLLFAAYNLWLYSPFIIHRDPKYIQVSASDLRDLFLGKREFELDLFDVLIRLLRQQDDQLYASFGNLRWRHFFESDFMVINVSFSFFHFFVPTAHIARSMDLSTVPPNRVDINIVCVLT